MDFGESRLFSRNPDLIEDRKTAVELIELYGKTPYHATKDDIAWFWADLRIETEPGDSQMAKDYVEENIEKLNTRYPFPVTEWFCNFYRYIPDIIGQKIDNTGQVDWDLFFTLANPRPGFICPFWMTIEKLDVKQNQLARRQIYRECADNPELRNKLIKGDVIPSMYTYYVSYQKIRKEVLKLTKTIDPFDPEKTLKPKIFRRAMQYMTKEGLNNKDALERATKEIMDELGFGTETSTRLCSQ